MVLLKKDNRATFVRGKIVCYAIRQKHQNSVVKTGRRRRTTITTLGTSTSTTATRTTTIRTIQTMFVRCGILQQNIFTLAGITPVSVLKKERCN